MLIMLLGLGGDLKNRWQGGGLGVFFKHFGLRVTPRRSTFFVSMPTLEHHYSGKNLSKTKIKVPTYPSSHVVSAEKIPDDLETIKILTPDP